MWIDCNGSEPAVLTGLKWVWFQTFAMEPGEAAFGHPSDWADIERAAPADHGDAAYANQGYLPHFSDMLPCDRCAHVDVTLVNGRMSFNACADDVDWQFVKYWRKRS